MQALTFRSFFAALVGLLTPFWIWAFTCLWQMNFIHMLHWWQRLSTFEPLTLDSYLSVEPTVVACWVVVALLSLFCTVLLFFTNYMDKIKFNSIYHVYVMQTLATLILVALQPQHAEVMMSMMLVSACPIIAHYFTLVNTMWSALVFWFNMVLLALLALLTQTQLFIPYIYI